jgi:hypothetical protein
VGVGGSLAVSLLVSSSCSGIGPLRPTDGNSGDEVPVEWEYVAGRFWSWNPGPKGWVDDVCGVFDMVKTLVIVRIGGCKSSHNATHAGY